MDEVWYYYDKMMGWVSVDDKAQAREYACNSHISDGEYKVEYWHDGKVHHADLFVVRDADSDETAEETVAHIMALRK